MSIKKYIDKNGFKVILDAEDLKVLFGSDKPKNPPPPPPPPPAKVLPKPWPTSTPPPPKIELKEPPKIEPGNAPKIEHQISPAVPPPILPPVVHGTPPPSQSDVSSIYPTPEQFNPGPPPKPPISLSKVAWKFGVLFVLIFILSYTLINEAAIAKKFNFFLNNSFGKTNSSQKSTEPVFDATASASLAIPKINVTAPIIWNIAEDNFTEKLLEGVVHFRGTALPGQNGNIFITGHSSYYSWVKSPYKDVFALLDRLSVGDKIYIQYNKVTYTYQVTGSKVVSPKNLEVLGSGSKPTLTLMTCVPIGTNISRLVITADQVGVSGLF